MGLHNRKHLDMIHDDIDFLGHQVYGVRKMAKLGSFLLADDMGLGKSLQALTVAAVDYQRLHPDGTRWFKRGIIVAPATLKWNWEIEILTHTNFTCMILDGTPKQRRKQLEEFQAGDVQWLIVNYEQVKAHLPSLNALRFDIGIFDEAHMMKNHKAARTQACLDLMLKRAFVLTGSPILNQVDDLWSLLHRIAPDQFPDYRRFVNRYAVWGGFKGKQIVGMKNKRELNDRLANYMIRRLKSECLDLPKKSYIDVHVGLTDLQRKMYVEAKTHQRITLPNGEVMEFPSKMVASGRMTQLCGTAAAIEGFEDSSEKLDVAVEKACELVASGEHLVVFTKSRAVLECFVQRMTKTKVRVNGAAPSAVPVYQLHGDVPMQDRAHTVQRWEAGPPGIIACMIQVAGVGLNMTKAANVFFLDRVWAPKLNEQCEDRLDRIGQTRPVTVYLFLVKGSVEDRVETIIRKKTRVFNQVVEESDWRQALEQALADRDEIQ